jgi:CelD/BcsL family acetyltransferase involved in cellulose biosynthesis
MKLLEIDPRSHPLWQELVQREPSSSFHSPAWLGVLADTYGFEIGASVLLDSAERPVAGLPFCRIADISGERLVALPFSDYCDPLAAEDCHWRTLAAHLVDQGYQVSLRCVHNALPLADERFTLVKEALWHGAALPPSDGELWERLEPSARRAIQKARREGVRVEAAKGREDLAAFFALHLLVRKYKYRLLAQPLRFFEAIWQRFIEPGRGALLLARREGRIIGGVLYLIWKDTLYYKFNASSPEALASRPNDLLLWEGMRYGLERGCAKIDFGLSDLDQPGLLQYKRKYASEEKRISFLRHYPAGGPTQQERQARQLLTQLATLLTADNVADSLTDRAGELLYQYFA